MFSSKKNRIKIFLAMLGILQERENIIIRNEMDNFLANIE